MYLNPLYNTQPVLREGYIRSADKQFTHLRQMLQRQISAEIHADTLFTNTRLGAYSRPPPPHVINLQTRFTRTWVRYSLHFRVLSQGARPPRQKKQRSSLVLDGMRSPAYYEYSIHYRANTMAQALDNTRRRLLRIPLRTARGHTSSSLPVRRPAH